MKSRNKKFEKYHVPDRMEEERMEEERMEEEGMEEG